MARWAQWFLVGRAAGLRAVGSGFRRRGAVEWVPLARRCACPEGATAGSPGALVLPRRVLLMAFISVS